MIDKRDMKNVNGLLIFRFIVDFQLSCPSILQIDVAFATAILDHVTRKTRCVN